MCSGVPPLLSFPSTSAPCPIRSLTVSRLPAFAAAYSLLTISRRLASGGALSTDGVGGGVGAGFMDVGVVVTLGFSASPAFGMVSTVPQAGHFARFPMNCLSALTALPHLHLNLMTVTPASRLVTVGLAVVAWSCEFGDVVVLILGVGPLGGGLAAKGAWGRRPRPCLKNCPKDNVLIALVSVAGNPGVRNAGEAGCPGTGRTRVGFLSLNAGSALGAMNLLGHRDLPFLTCNDKRWKSFAGYIDFCCSPSCAF